MPKTLFQDFIKKENLAQVFSCEFYKIFKNTFFTEHVWATASFDLPLVHKVLPAFVYFGK